MDGRKAAMILRWLRRRSDPDATRRRGELRPVMLVVSIVATLAAARWPGVINVGSAGIAAATAFDQFTRRG
jgi:hypothetical protein